MAVDLSRVAEYHVCQDDYGYWFITAVHEDGSLALAHHADTLDFALGDAERIAARDDARLVVEAAHEATLDQADYQPPESRKVR